MNLKNLSDEVLLKNTKRLVQRERELLSEILHHLREIESRRLFSQLGFSSLFEYATTQLGYADDQAGRRISAMRLLKELPELEDKISDGSLTLTNLSMAQTLFRREQKTEAFDRQEKLDLLAKLENKSKREAEKIIFSNSSDPIGLRPDQIRPLDDQNIEIKFSASARVQRKMEIVKGLLAHSHPNLKLGETLELICDIAIQQLDPAKRKNLSGKGLESGNKDSKIAERNQLASLSKSTPATISEAKTAHPVPAGSLTRLASATTPAPELKQRETKRKPITARVRREVWEKAGSQCQNCGSVHALQIDHIHPVATGGSNDSENLRLLCRSCNQRAAINVIGTNKMRKFLRECSLPFKSTSAF